MKNRMMKYVLVIAITMMAGINVFNAQKTDGLSDVALLNVEPLAQYEDGEGDKIVLYILNVLTVREKLQGIIWQTLIKG